MTDRPTTGFEHAAGYGAGNPKANPALAPGDRVQFSSKHLRNTCQHVGPDAPTDVGPWARGEYIGPHAELGDRFAVVKWDNGTTRTVAAGNLWPCGKPEPA